MHESLSLKCPCSCSSDLIGAKHSETSSHHSYHLYKAGKKGAQHAQHAQHACKQMQSIFV